MRYCVSLYLEGHLKYNWSVCFLAIRSLSACPSVYILLSHFSSSMFHYFLLCVGDNACLRCSFIFNSKQHVFAPLKQYGCIAMVNLQWFPSGCSKHCQIKNDLFRNKIFYSKSIKNFRAKWNKHLIKRYVKIVLPSPPPGRTMVLKAYKSYWTTYFLGTHLSVLCNLRVLIVVPRSFRGLNQNFPLIFLPERASLGHQELLQFAKMSPSWCLENKEELEWQDWGAFWCSKYVQEGLDQN